jgi:hypothetical protein
MIRPNIFEKIDKVYWSTDEVLELLGISYFVLARWNKVFVPKIIKYNPYSGKGMGRRAKYNAKDISGYKMIKNWSDQGLSDEQIIKEYEKDKRSDT